MTAVGLHPLLLRVASCDAVMRWRGEVPRPNLEHDGDRQDRHRGETAEGDRQRHVVVAEHAEAPVGEAADDDPDVDAHLVQADGWRPRGAGVEIVIIASAAGM